MHFFEHSSMIPCSQQEVFDYHARPSALQRLIPPWERITIEKQGDSLAVGCEVIIRHSLYGVPVRWVARHTELRVPDHFQDVQVSGPFKKWIHDHDFTAASPSSCILTDRIQYELRGGWLGWLGLPVVRRKLQSMFEYRHATTQADLRLQKFLAPFASNKTFRIGVTGSSGLVGRRLVDLIEVMGHEVVRILRNPEPSSRAGSSRRTTVWNANRGFQNAPDVEGLDAVIHLAGKSLADARWTNAVKREIRESRVLGTQALVRDLSKLNAPPKVLVCASGVGFYGDRGDEVLNESSHGGDDFLATLARDWEGAAMDFQRSGNRVVCGRLGIVLHPLQGALSKLLTPFRLGLGGDIGSGRHYWGWIDIDDAAGAFLYLAMNPDCAGAYNLVAPEQTDQHTFARSLAHALHRPAIIPAPAFALKWLLGEMAESMLLTSTRAVSEKLQQEGFPFRSSTLKACLRHLGV